MTVQIIKANGDIDYMFGVNLIIEFSGSIQINNNTVNYCADVKEIKELKVSME